MSTVASSWMLMLLFYCQEGVVPREIKHTDKHWTQSMFLWHSFSYLSTTRHKIFFEWVAPSEWVCLSVSLLSVSYILYRHSASYWNHLPTRQKLRHHVKADMTTWAFPVLLGNVVPKLMIVCVLLQTHIWQE